MDPIQALALRHLLKERPGPEAVGARQAGSVRFRRCWPSIQSRTLIDQGLGRGHPLIPISSQLPRARFGRAALFPFRKVR
jgi:hypothetical protein